MNEVLINKQLDHHNNHHEVYSFKCFLHCLFTKYGWMDELGGFLLHDIKQTLEESDIEVKSLEFILYKCTAIDSMNRCERAYKFTKCFWEIISEQQPSDDQLFYNVDEQNNGLIFK
uniref:OBP5 n=1 Tax=Hycleus phaleratus TaxID=1248972 RepID=A0A2U9NKV3_9CUCU|nr:OBP5 [Hycleus phaleratus]